jgi:hypothetical protein
LKEKGHGLNILKIVTTGATGKASKMEMKPKQRCYYGNKRK